MFDFNNEPEQKSDNYGPVPGGSKVMVRLSVETPQYAVADHPLVSETKKGLRGLWCKFTVIGGMYEGVKWYDTLWLPTGYQTARLDEGQIKACNRPEGSPHCWIKKAERKVVEEACPKS